MAGWGGFIHYGGGDNVYQLAATGRVGVELETIDIPVDIAPAETISIAVALETFEIPVLINLIEIEVDMATNTPLPGGIMPDIYQGDTTDVVLVYPEGVTGSLLPDWSCDLTVRDSEDDVVLTRPVTDVVDEKFRVYLTPTETEALGEGSFLLVAELKNPNTTPPVNREVHLTLKIGEQKA